MATQKALETFDTDGSHIKYGSVNWAPKGFSEQKCQTPFSETIVDRYGDIGGQEATEDSSHKYF